ncbi:hypothetical protein BHC54_10115 [Snodgrassella alvi]|uniref:Uncharacterized protein n=1 Tax=Snodgrassella alvi TaxID=1196083 RepID=A0A2N9X6N2_9NEIS|nr:hypothetical protein BHC54_10115 [Snodgrassella alvi]
MGLEGNITIKGYRTMTHKTIFPNSVRNQTLYEQYMEKRETPTYGAYLSAEQVKKRHAEGRVRG